ncbi:hypothetical protein BDF14DRAFT_1841107 [Spinellus fusiger]|nr:hypothetical protein BDF14DRAFT_1841107 [Spinellus fusiger]
MHKLFILCCFVILALLSLVRASSGILKPTNGTVWYAGSQVTVAIDLSDLDATNTASIFFEEFRSIGLAEGPIGDGTFTFTIPKDIPGFEKDEVVLLLVVIRKEKYLWKVYGVNIDLHKESVPLSKRSRRPRAIEELNSLEWLIDV